MNATIPEAQEQITRAAIMIKKTQQMILRNREARADNHKTNLALRATINRSLKIIEAWRYL